MKFCKRCDEFTERDSRGCCKLCVKARLAKWRADNREAIQVYTDKYRADNREAMQVSTARYYAEHREAKRVSAAKWRADNPALKKAGAAKYYAENTEAVKARARKWARDNPGKIRVRAAKYRAENPGTVRAVHAARRARKLQQTCTCCTPQAIADFYASASALGCQVDHKWALRLGGLHCLKNLEALTPAAHKFKTSEWDLPLIATGKRLALI